MSISGSDVWIVALLFSLSADGSVAVTLLNGVAPPAVAYVNISAPSATLDTPSDSVAVLPAARFAASAWDPLVGAPDELRYAKAR